MEVVVNNIEVTFHGIKPDVEVVKEYVKETGNTFDDISKLEEVEKFALWMVANKIPLPEYNPQYLKEILQAGVEDAMINGININETVKRLSKKYSISLA